MIEVFTMTTINTIFNAFEDKQNSQVHLMKSWGLDDHICKIAQRMIDDDWTKRPNCSEVSVALTGFNKRN